MEKGLQITLATPLHRRAHLLVDEVFVHRARHGAEDPERDGPGGFPREPGEGEGEPGVVAERVVAGRGFELVDVELKRQPGGGIVRLYVDKPGGIGLDDLQSVSEEVGAILDVEDPIASRYTLEVSSPGLDRPLKNEADYQRFSGRLAKLSSYEPVDGRRHWTGRLIGLADGIVEIDGDSVAANTVVIGMTANAPPSFEWRPK